MGDKYLAKVKKNRKGEWYWVVKCVCNGRTICKSSEGYANFDDCVVFLKDMNIPFERVNENLA